MNTPSLWQGRSDSAEAGDTRRLFQIVKTGPADYPAGSAVVLGFACDEGVKRNQGRPGASLGPAAIRTMLAGLPAHELEALWDAGDVQCDAGRLEQAQSQLAEKVAQILATGARLVVLGGGHEVAWGSFQGLSRHLEQAQPGLRKAAAQPGGSQADHGGAARNNTMGGTAQSPDADRTAAAKPLLLIVNLDAHFDLRTSRPGNSGTPFDQILEDCRLRGQPAVYACFGVSRLSNTPALFRRAEQLGAVHVLDIDMQERYLDQRLFELDRLIDQADHIYLTIDLDVLPAAVAPGVSAPAALGVPLCVIEAFAQRVKASGKMRLADIAELNPRIDIDHHTARVAARLVWGLLAP
jgi:formiminoglutamase